MSVETCRDLARDVLRLGSILVIVLVAILFTTTIGLDLLSGRVELTSIVTFALGVVTVCLLYGALVFMVRVILKISMLDLEARKKWLIRLSRVFYIILCLAMATPFVLYVVTGSEQVMYEVMAVLGWISFQLLMVESIFFIEKYIAEIEELQEEAQSR